MQPDLAALTVKGTPLSELRPNLSAGAVGLATALDEAFRAGHGRDGCTWIEYPLGFAMVMCDDGTIACYRSGTEAWEIVDAA